MQAHALAAGEETHRRIQDQHPRVPSRPVEFRLRTFHLLTPAARPFESVLRAIGLELGLSTPTLTGGTVRDFDNWLYFDRGTLTKHLTHPMGCEDHICDRKEHPHA